MKKAKLVIKFKKDTMRIKSKGMTLGQLNKAAEELNANIDRILALIDLEQENSQEEK